MTPSNTPRGTPGSPRPSKYRISPKFQKARYFGYDNGRHANDVGDKTPCLVLRPLSLSNDKITNFKLNATNFDLEGTFKSLNSRGSPFTDISIVPRLQSCCSSQNDDCDLDFRNGNTDEMYKELNSSMDDTDTIQSCRMTSISSNDTYITANTATPQGNSKYSFHSVIDSSDSYLTLTISTPNSPVSLELKSPHDEDLNCNSYEKPRSILKKEWQESEYRENNNISPTKCCNMTYKVHNFEIDSVEKIKLENVKKIIAEKILNTISNNQKKINVKKVDQTSIAGNVHDQTNNNNNVLETHL